MKRAKEIGKSTMSTNGVIFRYYHDYIEIRDIFNQRADLKLVEGLDKEVNMQRIYYWLVSMFILFSKKKGYRFFGIR
jgi:hypothetical protein